MVLTSHLLTLIVWNNVAVKLSLIAIGTGALPGVTFRMITVHVCLQSLFIGKYFSTVHSPPRGYIQSVVPSPLIRRPQSHRVQLLWLKKHTNSNFHKIINGKTPPHSSSRNKPYTPKTCSLKMAIFRMRTRTLERATLVEYTVAPVLASPLLALTGQLKTAQSQWDEYAGLFVTSPLLPAGQTKTSRMKKRPWSWKGPLWSADAAAPLLWQKQWSHNNNCGRITIALTIAAGRIAIQRRSNCCGTTVKSISYVEATLAGEKMKKTSSEALMIVMLVWNYDSLTDKGGIWHKPLFVCTKSSTYNTCLF